MVIAIVLMAAIFAAHPWPPSSAIGIGVACAVGWTGGRITGTLIVHALTAAHGTPARSRERVTPRAGEQEAQSW